MQDWGIGHSIDFPITVTQTLWQEFRDCHFITLMNIYLNLPSWVRVLLVEWPLAPDTLLSRALKLKKMDSHKHIHHSASHGIIYVLTVIHGCFWVGGSSQQREEGKRPSPGQWKIIGEGNAGNPLSTYWENSRMEEPGSYSPMDSESHTTWTFSLLSQTVVMYMRVFFCVYGYV